MPNKQTCILAIDLGTSGPKVALVTPEGEILSRTRRTIPIHFLPDGGIEQSPDDWWQSIREATRQVLAESGVAREAVAAVYCASLYSTTLPVDPQGQPLMNAILWMDTRGAPYVAEITRGWIRIQRYGCHGSTRLESQPFTKTPGDPSSRYFAPYPARHCRALPGGFASGRRLCANASARERANGTGLWNGRYFSHARCHIRTTKALSGLAL